MSEQDNPASRGNSHWLMGEADLLRFDRQRGDAWSSHGLPSSQPPTGSRAKMPPPSGSGYEQILAARGELRIRLDRAVADERRPSLEPAAAPSATAAATRSPERPAGRPPRRLDGRDRPALFVWGLLTAPAACVLLAFTWAGPPRSPATAPGAVGASLPVAGSGVVAAPPSASGGELVLATRHAQPGRWPDDAEPVPNGAEAEPTFAAQGGGPGPQTAEAGTGPAQESVLPDAVAVPNGLDMLLEEVREAFATWDRLISPWAADDGPQTSPEAASRVLGAGPAEGEPVLVARDRAVPAAEAGSGAGTPLAAVGAALDAEPTRDDPAEARAAAEVAPGPAEPAVPETVEAAEPARQGETGNVIASAEARHRDAAPATEAASPVGEGPQAPAARPGLAARFTEAAPSAAGTDAAAGAEASGGSSAAPAPQTAALVALPPAKPRLSGTPPPPSVSRSAAPGDAPAAPASPPTDPRCRTIIVKAQLGEETSHAERLLLRNGCGARR